MNQNTAPEPNFQDRVALWMRECFSPEISEDKLERSDRFIEESLELVQASGYSADRAHALVDYVFDRPAGELKQEVGGVAVTLAALCNTHSISVNECAETELARIWTKIDAIRAKQARKPVGSALPVPLGDLAVELSREALERIQSFIEVDIETDCVNRERLSDDDWRFAALAELTKALEGKPK